MKTPIIFQKMLSKIRMDKESSIITLIDISLPSGERLSFTNHTEDILFSGRVYTAIGYDITILDDKQRP